MSETNSNPLSKVIGRVFPKVPDFFALLNKQCDLAVEVARALETFMINDDEVSASRVRELEAAGDAVRDANMDVLNRAFTTPMDREDLYRAISTIDAMMNDAKTTVRDMAALAVVPDDFTREMSASLREGALALQQGYALLAQDPAQAEQYATAARKAERNTEKVYRRALAELFDLESEATILDTQASGPTGGTALRQMMVVMKKREIYRHLSNSADRVARAGEVLHDIVVKMV